MSWLIWLVLGLSLASPVVTVWLALAVIKTLRAERLAALSSGTHRQHVMAADETWVRWVADGWELAEASSARSQKENDTKPNAADKRAIALGWVKEQAEKNGVEWGNTQASFAAKLLELHHGRRVRKARVDSSV